MSEFGYPFPERKLDDVPQGDTYIALCKRLVTFLRYMQIIEGSSDRIYKPVMANTVSFLQSNYQIACKMSIYFWLP